jgi:hypothetical protein
MLWTIAAIVLAGLWLAIDDPGRDFTSNHAAIEADADDPGLRPRTLPGTTAEAIDVVRQAARRIKNWEYIGTARVGDVSTVVFERTSRVWRLKDDIVIRIEERGGRCRVTGESRSRHRFGDLGQNPRNLRRILAELDRVLDHG